MTVGQLKSVLESAPHDAEIKVEDGEIVVSSPQRRGGAERIKTFMDAAYWCEEHNMGHLVTQYDFVAAAVECSAARGLATDEWVRGTQDILAYLKLRVITAALNEGWEPTFDKSEKRWKCWIEASDGTIHTFIEDSDCTCQGSCMLCFKSKELASYAAEQFRDLYADFCGCKKGGEK